MSRKRRFSGHRSTTDHYRRNERRSTTPLRNRLYNQVLAALYRIGTPVSINDIASHLGLSRTARKDIADELTTALKEGAVHQSGKRLFALTSRHALAEATVVLSASGYAFATALSRNPFGKQTAEEKDPYIKPAHLHGAMHGDRVLLVVSAIGRQKRRQAEVLSIISRSCKQLAGFFHRRGRFGSVTPDDSRYPFTIALTETPQNPINDGDAVIVSLQEGTETTEMKGRVVEILGSPHLAAVQCRLVITKFSLPYRFSIEAEKQAQSPGPDPAQNHRKDLRTITHITIDGTDAKDFDDAVAVLRYADGYRLYVSIADVSAFVQTGSQLDREAYARGTSVYFPDAVVPMLPEHLSNNLCSLIPHTDRLAVTAILDFDRQGQMTNNRFLRSVIRSHHRFSYDVVEKLLTQGTTEPDTQLAELTEQLHLAAELARILQENRQQRGSIAFSLPEAAVILTENGTIETIRRAERLFSHQIIEEFMLAANEAVARLFAERDEPLLFRIHEPPAAEKIRDFEQFSRSIGLELPNRPATPQWYNNLIAQVTGTPFEYIINNLLLRTMQQARYEDKNTGHFGLASAHYTHFTSPIRRYPDLIVHRQLCQLLERHGAAGPPPHTTLSPAASLANDAIHLSDRERTAVAAERDMLDRMKCLFMERHRGDTFAAVVSSVGENAFFVELLDVQVEGSVSLATCTDDYYILDEKRHRLVGDRSGNVIQIGNLVTVTVIDIDYRLHRISFTLTTA